MISHSRRVSVIERGGARMNELTPPDNAGPLATGTVSPRWAFRSEPNPSPYASRVAPLGARSLNSDTQALWATEPACKVRGCGSGDDGGAQLTVVGGSDIGDQ